MTIEEANKLYQMRLQQLHLSVIYETEFLEKLGQKRLNELRDDILDNIIELRKLIKNVH